MPLIQYKREGALRWEGDEVLGVEACPFPLIEPGIAIDINSSEYIPPAWKVVEFGRRVVDPGYHDPKYGRDHTWAHVIYEKRCGHTVKERISFSEGVQSFDHYGTHFEGASYSIKDWERRIKFFQNICLCDICAKSFHRWWIIDGGFWDQRGVDPVEILSENFDRNYENWREFLDIQEDFPNGRRTPVWRPKNRPRPNKHRETHENNHISGSDRLGI